MDPGTHSQNLLTSRGKEALGPVDLVFYKGGRQESQTYSNRRLKVKGTKAEPEEMLSFLERAKQWGRRSSNLGYGVCEVLTVSRWSVVLGW